MINKKTFKLLSIITLSLLCVPTVMVLTESFGNTKLEAVETLEPGVKTNGLHEFYICKENGNLPDPFKKEVSINVGNGNLIDFSYTKIAKSEKGFSLLADQSFYNPYKKEKSHKNKITGLKTIQIDTDKKASFKLYTAYEEDMEKASLDKTYDPYKTYVNRSTNLVNYFDNFPSYFKIVATEELNISKITIGYDCLTENYPLNGIKSYTTHINTEFAGGLLEADITYDPNAKSIILPRTDNGKPIEFINFTHLANSVPNVETVYIPSTYKYLDCDQNFAKNFQDRPSFIGFYYEGNKDDLGSDFNFDLNTLIGNFDVNDFLNQTKFVDDQGFNYLVMGDKAILLAYTGNKTDIEVPDAITLENGQRANVTIINGFNKRENTLNNVKTLVFNKGLKYRQKNMNIDGISALKVCRGDKIDYEWDTYAVGFNYVSDLGKNETYVYGSFNFNGDTLFTICDYLLEEEGAYVVPEFIDNKKVEAIGNDAYRGATFSSITVNENIKYIGDNAFSAMPFLTSVDLSKVSLEKLPDNLFLGSGQLKTFLFPKNVKVIGSSCFASCYALEKIILPATIETIETQAFNECSSLSSITLNDGLKKISTNAFMFNYNLNEITIPSSVEIVEKEAFSYVPTNVNVPFKEGQKPAGWANDWYNGQGKIIYQI